MTQEHLDALVETFRLVASSVQQISQSRVEQARIRAEADQEIAKVQAVRDVLLHHLDRSFDERRANFTSLFGVLDKAIETGPLEAVAKTLDAVVALAIASPFKDLADATKANQMLKDKSREWEL